MPVTVVNNGNYIKSKFSTDDVFSMAINNILSLNILLYGSSGANTNMRALQ